MPATEWKSPSQIELVPDEMAAQWSAADLPMQASAYSHQSLTQIVRFRDFDIDLPSGETPKGIEVRAVGHANIFGPEGSAQLGPTTLLLPGSAERYWGGPSYGTLNTNPSESIASGPTDLFGLAPAAEEVNSPEFGIALAVAPTVYDGAIDVTLSEIQVRVHY